MSCVVQMEWIGVGVAVAWRVECSGDQGLGVVREVIMGMLVLESRGGRVALSSVESTRVRDAFGDCNCE